MVKVVFLHPDLGIGGAERLVVDAALALKTKGHQVHFLSCHHDPDHCFEETQPGSTLDVTVVGDWLPRSLFGYCYALCAYIRMIYAAIILTFFPPDHLKDVDAVFVDQVSACIPALKIGFNRPDKIVFYCHYPDQLLTDRVHPMKKLYRKPLDYCEEITTGMADTILVNSKFTGGVFKNTFQRIQVSPEVLYPTLSTEAFDRFERLDPEGHRPEDTFTFLSVNRYERKKNLSLAIRAFDQLKKETDVKANFIMVGGYDTRVTENVEHLRELQDLVSELSLEEHVTFRTSTPTEEKVELMMKTCHALLYTPSGEHFGIVPVEAMYSKLPVIAVNDGGPLETVEDGITGYLCPPNKSAFAKAMGDLVKANLSERKAMGEAGRERVRKLFSFQSFAHQLHEVMTK